MHYLFDQCKGRLKLVKHPQDDEDKILRKVQITLSIFYIDLGKENYVNMYFSLVKLKQKL